MILLTACPILMNELERDKVWARMMLVATKRVSLALCHNMSHGSRGSQEPGFFHALLASPSGISTGKCERPFSIEPQSLHICLRR